MADVKICDRCRKEITERQTIINLRPSKRYILSVDVLARPAGANYLLRTAGHSFDLCDSCANKLAEFLRYIPDSVAEATDE